MAGQTDLTTLLLSYQFSLLHTRKNDVHFVLLWTEQIIYSKNLYYHSHLHLSLSIVSEFALTAVSNLVK